MIITCGKCQAKFKVAPEQIKETGSKVRCSNCKYVFTVFRPQKPLEVPRPEVKDENLDDDYMGGVGGKSEADSFKYGMKDFYGQEPSSESSGDYLDESFDLDDDSYSGDGPPICTSDDVTSLKERRERRRQLYSDLGGGSATDDCLDDAFDDIDDGDDEPHLRRGRKSQMDEDADDSESLADDLVDEALSGSRGNAWDDGTLDARLPSSRGDSLGLSADPSDVPRIVDDGRSYPAGLGIGLGSHEPASIRPAITKTKKRNTGRLIVGLFILAAILGGGFYFISSRPERIVLSSDDPITDNTGQDTSEINNGDSDKVGKDLITFANKQQPYYFNNKHAGKLLVIVGKVYNAYPEDRSFIRLRGLLEAQDGTILAERYAYAGNILSEEDLINLPMEEISARLNMKGGQDGQNMNIKPGQGIDFMVAFDKIPSDVDSYRITSVGSSPASGN